MIINLCFKWHVHLKKKKDLHMHVHLCVSDPLPCNIMDICLSLVFQKVHVFFFCVVVVVVIIIQQDKCLVLLKVCLKRGEGEK